MLSIKEVVKLSAMFCPLWFFANYFFNLSLSMTSVSSNTILSTTSGLFTLILGTILRIDKFSILKLLAVLVSFGGVVMVSLADKSDSSQSDTVLGDILSLLSAVFYAGYSVLLKKRIDSEERLHGPMLLGFLGAINTVVLFPVLILFSVTGLEHFEFPTGKVFGFLTIQGLIGTVLSDYLWLLSVLLTSPLIATLGLSLTTVLAMVVDIIFRGRHFPTMYVLGALAVLSGFLLVNTDQYINVPIVVKRVREWRHRGGDRNPTE
eukprot:TRINITY_DN6553_c0_g1_i2.p1 TRINITY_DN6553_c0_g1~~TRINITY_DN6553_c0_g1_i2.p1  ORF type:complete len:263 (+),score=63.36 TRINITY_DN6553_c0_g1_i2:350-1138(+)